MTSIDGGDVIYTVTCTDGERIGVASVTLRWALSPPSVSLSTFDAPSYGVPFQVFWTSNVRPCTASGGNAGDGWGGSLDRSGIATITETVVGSVTYTLTCGSGARSALQQLTVNVAAPLAVVTADAVSLRVGQSVNITTATRGAPCVRTGGRAGDGWAGSAPLQGGVKTISESTPGTVTYGLACGSGSHVATAQATVTFTDDPPAVAVRASPSSGVVIQDVITFSWDSNVRPCTRRLSGPVGSYEIDSAPNGSDATREYVIGEYVFSVTCGAGADTAHGSTVVSWTGTPSVEIKTPSAVVRGALFSVGYFTNVVPCTLSGGSPGAFWPGPSNQHFGSVQRVEQNAGTVTYMVVCGSGPLTVSARADVEVVADAPQVTLTADTKAQVTGRPVTLTWSSNMSPCVPGGGRSGDGWSGSFGSAGSATVTEQRADVYFFSITCGTGSLTARASEGVIYADVPAPALTASKTEATVGEPITLTWSSADASPCFATGGAQEDGWFGNRAPSGSVEVRRMMPGLVYFMLKCGQSLEASVQITIRPVATVPEQSLPPSVNLVASASSLTVGEALTLTWTASRAESCVAGGGGQASSWRGTLTREGGSRTLTEASSGAFVYEITCYGVGGTSAIASARVTVIQPAPPSTGNSEAGGGGGAMGALDGALLLLFALAAHLRRGRFGGLRRAREASLTSARD